MQMPTLSDLTSGKASIDEIKPIYIEDLLERNPNEPNQKLLESAIKEI